MEILQTKFLCIIVLQSRGDWPKNAWKQDLRLQNIHINLKNQLLFFSFLQIIENLSIDQLCAVANCYKTSLSLEKY